MPTRLRVLSPEDARKQFDRLIHVTGSSLQAAADAAVAAGGGVLWVPRGQTVTITATTALPDLVSGLQVDGEVVIDADVPLFTRSGTVVGSTVNITAAITAGARTVSAASAPVVVDDWVFVASADTLSGTTDKLGYLRKIRAVTTGSVSFDVSIPRDMIDSSRRFRKVTLAAPFELSGKGVIRYSSPGTRIASMMEFTFCRDVVVRPGIELRDGGGRCIHLAHVAGFTLAGRIDNFADDIPNGHVGYGVDVSGACRDGLIEGVITRCRHAVTTNVGPAQAQFNFYGEPENVIFRPVTSACTDKALDTHRAGWGITMHLQDKGSGGGAQVRADNVYVDGVCDGNYVGAPLVVQADVAVPPTIGPFRSVNSAGGGIVLNSSATFLVAPRVDNLLSGVPVTVAPGKVMRLGGREASKLVADLVVTNSTTPVEALTVPVDARTTYQVEAFIIYKGPAAADMLLGWLAPAGCTLDWYADGLSTATTTTGSSVVRQYRTLADSSAVGSVTTAVATVVRAIGYLEVGDTAGLLRLRVNQFVADAGSLSVMAGSRLTVTQAPQTGF